MLFFHLLVKEQVVEVAFYANRENCDISTIGHCLIDKTGIDNLFILTEEFLAHITC